MTTPQIKAIAFDLDGTLIDSVPDLMAATNACLAELSLPLSTDEQVRSWVGNGAKVMMERAITFGLGHAVTPEQLDEVMPRFVHHYQLCLQKYSQLYEGVIEVLTQLLQQGYKMAIVTNKPHHFTVSLLQAFKLTPFFEIVLGGDSLAKMKPDPLPLNSLLNSWQLEPSELLMVGDSKNDIIAAKAANCRSIGLTYGYNYGEPISDSEPDQVCEQFFDILTYLSVGRNAMEQETL